MVYRNPYHGYSDTEYGYNGEQLQGNEQVYQYHDGNMLHHVQANGGHHVDQEHGTHQVIVRICHSAEKEHQTCRH